VSKLTCSFALDAFISSRIHCRAAPMPRVLESGFDSRLRVSKLTSFSIVFWSRSAEICSSSFTTRASTSASAGAAAAPPAAPASSSSVSSARFTAGSWRRRMTGAV
jgi:hypothetical protein